jgi:hypothetical protein
MSKAIRKRKFIDVRKIRDNHQTSSCAHIHTSCSLSWRGKKDRVTTNAATAACFLLVEEVVVAHLAFPACIIKCPPALPTLSFAAKKSSSSVGSPHPS